MYMKRVTIILCMLLLVLSSTTHAQIKIFGTTYGSEKVKGSKNYVTKEMRMSDFSKLSITGSPNVTFVQKSGKPRVEVYTSDNLIDLLEIVVENNTLKIGWKKGYNISYDKLNITVTAKELNSITIAGSGDLLLKNGLNTESLNLSIAGSGDIEGSNLQCSYLKSSVAGSGTVKLGEVKCKTLSLSIAGSGDMVMNGISTTDVKAHVSGSGTLRLSGTAEKAKFSVAGSGDIFADELKSKRVEGSISGSGDIKCHATEYLKARTSGSGSIGYKGNPELDMPKKHVYQL